MLETLDEELKLKEGDRIVEEKLGIKLMNRYNTIQFFDSDY